MRGQRSFTRTLFEVAFVSVFVLVGASVAVGSAIRGEPAGALFGLLFGGFPGWFAIRAIRLYLRPPDARPNVIVRAAARSGASAASGYRTAAAAEPDLLSAYGDALETLPVPKLERERGGELPVRLSRTARPGTTALFIAVFALVWNAVAWPTAIASFSARSGFAALLPWLFVAVGIVLVLVAWLQAGAWLGSRRAPVVELSREPLAPGDAFEVLVAQPGPVKVLSYKLRLICEERVSWTAGDDTSSETETVFERTLLEEVAFTIPRFGSWKRRVNGAIPARAMHSFEAPHNAVEWRLVVRAVLDGWPDLEESYALRILPAPRDGTAP